MNNVHALPMINDLPKKKTKLKLDYMVTFCKIFGSIILRQKTCTILGTNVFIYLKKMSRKKKIISGSNKQYF